MKSSGKFGTASEIFRLAAIVYCDDVPEMVDAATIFGETRTNTSSLVFDLANILESRVKKIAISAGYSLGEQILPSFKEITKDLYEWGVSKKRIIQFPLSTKLPPCTDAEAIGFVAFAKEQGWKSVFLVAPPLHQFRAFVSLVSAIKKASSDLVVWNWVCGIRDWNETIIHSQSAPKDKRLNLLASELEKIERYYRKGDLMSAEEVLDYIARRYQ